MALFLDCHEGHKLLSFHLEQMKALIIKTAKPDKIFLLGASMNLKKSESIFVPSRSDFEQCMGCSLLILLPDLMNKEAHEWQDQLEARCTTIMPLTTIVLRTATFIGWLREGHAFAARVCERSPVLYDSGLIRFTCIGDPDSPIQEAEPGRLHHEGVSAAGEFLAAAEFYFLREQYRLAAFMLHQSAEQSLRTILKTGTGFHANTHSIDRLLRYASLAAHAVKDLFPRDTELEKRIFTLLQQAYSGARYRTDYFITREEASLLINRIKALYNILIGADGAYGTGATVEETVAGECEVLYHQEPVSHGRHLLRA